MSCSLANYFCPAPDATTTPRGAIKVTGSAGTGKTVVAMHRARTLARRGLRVLLTSFVTTLVGGKTSHGKQILRISAALPSTLTTAAETESERISRATVRQKRGSDKARCR